ncbi:MAG: hypothetical protein VYE73_12195 [Acidobacteriota bacterium]|nr:hypothetical protein [Acidobacteriota bacterium]
MAFAPAYPHDPIEEITQDVYMARGSIRMNPVVRLTRNMAIVRHAGELTLVNPIRLNDQGLQQLEALGDVKHIIRLGPFHGVDDPFYMDRYEPAFWSLEGGKAYTEPAIDHALTEAGELPFPGAELWRFEKVKQPEGVLLLNTGGGVLLTCDAVQHYGDYSNCNLAARIMMPLIGFRKTTLVGPIWLKLMTPEGASLQDQFERLLTLRFGSLLSAHGTLLRDGAHQAVTAAVARAFPTSP